MTGVISCQQYPQGKQLYNAYCINCHMADGSGLVGLVPSYHDPHFLSFELDEMTCKIKYGSTRNPNIEFSGEGFNPMPEFTNLNDTEISNIINYINTHWGNKTFITSPRQVREALDACENQ